MAIFSFVGIELVGVTAGEAEDPSKTLPKAVNQIPLRILLFYVGALFVIMSIYPWNRLNPDASPFVRVFADIGLPAAAGIINFVVLTSAASSCNSGIFSTSRMLYSLAEDGKAPKMFKKLNKRNVPAPALLGSTIMLLIGVVLNYFMKSTQVFTLVTSISSICFVWVWGVIMVAHLRFRKNMPEEAAKISFKLPFAPVINWVVLLFFVFVLVVLGIAKDTRVALFVTPVWFILLVIAYGLTRKKKSI
jgi:D-serine/D-alanine/glycine transporter